MGRIALKHLTNRLVGKNSTVTKVWDMEAQLDTRPGYAAICYFFWHEGCGGRALVRLLVVLELKIE